MDTTRNNDQDTSWWKRNYIEALIVASGLVLINLIFIPKAFRQTNTVDPEAAAQLGAFVGGYFGAIFALVGVVLLYSTLKSQRSSSQQQNFETKYFELIKMHRDNVAELQVQDVRGRRLFVMLIRELRCALEIIRAIAEASKQQLTPQRELHLAYYCLFYGTGPHSSRMLRMSLPTFNADFVEKVEHALSKQETKDRVQRQRNFGYVPFEGHQSRLGHYYRHLYQMIRYVDQQP